MVIYSNKLKSKWLKTIPEIYYFAFLPKTKLIEQLYSPKQIIEVISYGTITQQKIHRLLIFPFRRSLKLQPSSRFTFRREIAFLLRRFSDRAPRFQTIGASALRLSESRLILFVAYLIGRRTCVCDLVPPFSHRIHSYKIK